FYWYHFLPPFLADFPFRMYLQSSIHSSLSVGCDFILPFSYTGLGLTLVFIISIKSPSMNGTVRYNLPDTLISVVRPFLTLWIAANVYDFLSLIMLVTKA